MVLYHGPIPGGIGGGRTCRVTYFAMEDARGLRSPEVAWTSSWSSAWRSAPMKACSFGRFWGTSGRGVLVRGMLPAWGQHLRGRVVEAIADRPRSAGGRGESFGDTGRFRRLLPW